MFYVSLAPIVLALGYGLWTLATSFTLRSTSDPYTYGMDSNGNEVVKDNTDAQA